MKKKKNDTWTAARHMKYSLRAKRSRMHRPGSFQYSWSSEYEYLELVEAVRKAMQEMPA
jgi:hypothetical protein